MAQFVELARQSCSLGGIIFVVDPPTQFALLAFESGAPRRVHLGEDYAWLGRNGWHYAERHCQACQHRQP